MFAKLKTCFRARSSEDYKNMLVFEENMRILHYTGFWRPDNEEKNRFYYVRRGLEWYVIFYNVYYVFIGLPMYIYLHCGQFSLVAEALANEMTSLMGCTNFLTTYLQNDGLNKLVQIMRDMYDNHCPKNKETLRITESTKKLCHFLSDTLPRTTFYLFWLIGSIEFYTVLKERDISDRTKCWYPFDSREQTVLEILVFAFLFNFVLGVINTLATDAFIVCMFLHTRTQLKVLQLKLQDLRFYAERIVARNQQRVSEHKYDNKSTRRWQLLQNKLNVQKSVDLEMKTLLGECVAHHCEILEFFQEFEKFWNPIFSMKIIVNLSISVLILVSSSVKSGESTALVLLTIGLLFYLEYAMFSYFAEQVAEEMSQLKEAVYDSDWFGAEEGFKRSMMIIISAANESTSVRAGGFVPLTMETLLSVMKTVYSYYNVMRKI